MFQNDPVKLTVPSARMLEEIRIARSAYQPCQVQISGAARSSIITASLAQEQNQRNLNAIAHQNLKRLRDILIIIIREDLTIAHPLVNPDPTLRKSAAEIQARL